MVVAAELTREPYDDAVVIGPTTRETCDLAISIAAKDPKRHVLFATAGIAPHKWDKVWMARAMREYVRSENPALTMEIYCASIYSTQGEMRTFANRLFMQRDTDDIEEVIIACKSWHAPRARYLCLRWLKLHGLGHIPVSSSIHVHEPGLWLLLREVKSWVKLLLREGLSWIKLFVRNMA